MPPIRVLRVIARMNVGGPAWQVSVLTRGLDPSEFETLLVAGDVDDGEVDMLTFKGDPLPVTRIDGLGRAVDPSRDVAAYRALVRTMRSFRPDIVHTHTAKAGVLGRIAAARTGVPATVHTFHGHLLHGYFSRPVRRLVVTTEQVLARRTTRLVAVGAQVRDELLAARIGRRDQYRVVPPGVDLSATSDRPGARSRLGLAADVPVVAFVARLTAVKRPDRLVAVAEHVLRARPDATFLVSGDGPDMPVLEAAAQRLGPSFRLLGWQRDVRDVYAASDLALLTSDNEGMPVTLIEAAASGCPAVATAVGSVAEVVEDGVTGHVVPPGDVEALGRAVLAILDSPEARARMGAAARARAEERFGTDRLVRDTEAIYREISGR